MGEHYRSMGNGRHIVTNGLIIGQEVVDWMRSKSDEFGCGEATGIGWLKNGRIVAGVCYTDYNGVNVSMHVAAEGKNWLRREYLWACFDYPFNQLKVNRITGLVGEGNTQARKFDEHIGFTLETTLAGAHPTGDLLVYRMFRSECRWLSLDLKNSYAQAA